MGEKRKGSHHKPMARVEGVEGVRSKRRSFVLVSVEDDREGTEDTRGEEVDNKT